MIYKPGSQVSFGPKDVITAGEIFSFPPESEPLRQTAPSSIWLISWGEPFTQKTLLTPPAAIKPFNRADRRRRGSNRS